MLYTNFLLSILTRILFSEDTNLILFRCWELEHSSCQDCYPLLTFSAFRDVRQCMFMEMPLGSLWSTHFAGLASRYRDAGCHIKLRIHIEVSSRTSVWNMLFIDLKGFWRWCTLNRIHRTFLDSFHRPVFQKNTTFRKLDLKVGRTHLFSWAP
jgi:hypothetical protein